MLEQHGALRSCHEFELWAETLKMGGEMWGREGGREGGREREMGGLPNTDGNRKLLATESASIWSSAAVTSKIWVINELQPLHNCHSYCVCVSLRCTVKCYSVLLRKKAGSRVQKVILFVWCKVNVHILSNERYERVLCTVCVSTCARPYLLSKVRKCVHNVSFRDKRCTFTSFLLFAQVTRSQHSSCAKDILEVRSYFRLLFFSLLDFDAFYPKTKSSSLLD